MIRRSLTLVLGLLLTVGAFLGFLLWGRLTNPPPYRVVVAVENIPPFTELREEMFAVDEQIIAPQVAQRYVLEQEIGEEVSHRTLHRWVCVKDPCGTGGGEKVARGRGGEKGDGLRGR